MLMRAAHRTPGATGRRAALLIACFLFVAAPAAAQSSASSSAYGAAVGMTLLPLLGAGIPIDLPAQPVAQGSGPPSYSDGPYQTLSVNVSTPLTGPILSTGALVAFTVSDVPDNASTASVAEIDGLSLNLAGLVPLLTLSASTITSNANISGDCGAFAADGDSVIEDAQVGGTLGLGLVLPQNPQPNLVLLDLLGLRVIVNEQILTGDGVTSLGLAVNALRVELDVSILGIGALSGEIVLGHSEAYVECSGAVTPTPTVAPTPTPTPGGGPTPTPGGGPTPTPDGGATPTPSGGATPTPGAQPTPTDEPTPVAPTPSPSPTPAPNPTPTPLPGPAGTDPHTDELGLGDEGFAGMTLNPGGVGQLLYGTLYDVRRVAGLAGEDDQAVNIQIVNLNPLGGELGGVLARVRFRESKTSREVYAFDVALSCGEVWAGVVTLGDAGVPTIRSRMPIVTSLGSTTLTTGPALDPTSGGAEGVFEVPNGLAADDVRRGYFEVIAQEQLPCEPLEGGFVREGNTFARLTGDLATPPNSLAGHVALVRAVSGVAYDYEMPAIARFVIDGGGSIAAPLSSGLPDVRSCINWDKGSESPYSGLASCRDQLDLVLSKSKLHVTYDVSPLTAGKTFLVLALPTKGVHCTDDVASPPFRCSPSGERIGCRTFDREENELFPSPECNLPRELSILQIGGPPDARADQTLATGNFISGWMTFSLASDPAPGGSGVHERRNLDPDRASFLGVRASGFRGLPALPLVLQEYFNGNVGGTFGMLATAPSEIELYGIDP